MGRRSRIVSNHIGMASLTGSIFNITPTPFNDDGALDLESLRRLTVFTRGKGVNGMTILGVLGEADKLTEAERDSVIATAIEAAGPDFPICVGTTHAGTEGCIAYSQRAQELGAKAVMVAPPRMARVNDAALERALSRGGRRHRHPGGRPGFSAGGRRAADERGGDRAHRRRHRRSCVT